MPKISQILNQAQVCRQAGQRQEAEQHCRLALQLANRLKHADAFYNVGIEFLNQGLLGDATRCFSQTLLLNPRDADALNNLGLVLSRQNKLAEAVTCFEEALRLEPNNFAAHNNLGGALLQQDKLSEGVASFRQAIALKADYLEAHSNLAHALLLQYDLDEALACIRKALELAPQRPKSSFDLGYVLLRQNKLDEALAGFDRALELDGDYADAHLSRALALLAAGRLKEGWPEYEWRLRRPGHEEQQLPHDRWSGQPLDGHTILLRSEQGLGDTLQFIRFAEVLKERGGTVIVECHASLTRLIATESGVDEVVAKGESLPPFDYHIPLLSVPGVLGSSLDNLPAQVPYLHADPTLVAQWRTELQPESQGASHPFKVGVAWQGSPGNKSDRDRSIPLESFGPLAGVSGVELYSLQVGAGRDQFQRTAGRWPITDLGDRLGDFYNTAAAVCNLDLLITCDSASAHLAGALGRPVWVALPYSPDWRWMLARADSPWYPTMRLFRQQHPGSWAQVFDDIRAAICNIV